jgi:tetratricopeptide (TPR) repeat protein
LQFLENSPNLIHFKNWILLIHQDQIESKMKDGNWKIYPKEVIHGVDYSNIRSSLTPDLKQALNKMHEKATKNKPGVIKQLLKLIQQYPSVPTFKNYLVTAYLNKGEKGKAREVNRRILEEHPDYLFGKVTLAADYIDEGRYEEVPQLLGEALELKALYPRKHQFHISEVISFYKVVFKYHIETGNLEKAEECLHILRQVAPRHTTTQKLIYQLMARRMEINRHKRKEYLEKKRTVDGKSYDRHVQTTLKPYFQHPYEMQALYRNDLRINPEIVERILQQPRQSLIRDLEKVVGDSIRRFEFFKEEAELKGWNEKVHNFQLHALFMLTELHAEESLGAVLDLLRQGKEFMEFWFSEHLTETVWEVIYSLGNRQLNTLGDFIKEPNINTYCKYIVVIAVSQVAFHQPERRAEVIDWFDDVLVFFLENQNRKDILDTEVISRIVAEIAAMKARELIPSVRELYIHDLISEYLVGNWETFLQKINEEPAPQDHKRPVFGIFDRYRHIISNWYSFAKGKKNNSL